MSVLYDECEWILYCFRLCNCRTFQCGQATALIFVLEDMDSLVFFSATLLQIVFILFSSHVNVVFQSR